MERSAEISALIETLHRTERRLEELTQGEIDTVVDAEGRSFLLRRAQEELRSSESLKQAAILNALPAQIALLNGEGLIVSVNESWRLFATANVLHHPGFGIGQNYVEICENVVGDYSGEAQAAARGIRLVLQGEEKEFILEYPCHSPDEKRWFRLAVSPVNYERSAGAVVMHLNITERRLSEEALRESEERFRGMFIGAAAGIAISTPNGCYLQANSAYCHMLGYTEEELKAMDFVSVTHPEDLDLNLVMRNELLAGERDSLTMEKRYVKKGGEIIWVQVSVSPTHSLAGKVQTLIVIANDISVRKAAEEQLRSKTALLEGQVNSTLDGILVVDSEGNKILQNQQMVSLWNLPKEFADDAVDQRQREWVGQQLKNPEEFAEKFNYLHTHPDEVSRDELELMDGRFFERYSSPVRGENGKHYGRIWAMRDITERKRAAQKLEELSRHTAQRERLLSTALAAMSDFAQIYDLEGRILFANQPLLDLWGMTLADVVGKNFSDLQYPQELADKVQGQLRQVIETKKAITDEAAYTSPTGVAGYYEYIFSPALSAEGRVDFVVGTTRDVTQRRAAEMQIRLNEQRYRLLVEATTAIVWDTPGSGQFTEDQPGWTAFTGQTFAELRGWGWLDAVHPEDRAETARVWSIAVADRVRYDVEHRLRIPDKTYRNMMVRAVPILNDDGSIRQWVGIHTDITERKKLEHQFLRAQRMESIGTLAGGVAHDLNNILAPILMSIQILKLTATDPENARILSTIETSAKRGADIVRQVLSFARGMEGQRIEVQAKHLLGEVENIIRETFPKNIQVEFLVPNDTWTIQGDPTQIHQILLNLCVNARDAMLHGGSLLVSLENCVLDKCHSAMNLQAKLGRYVQICVTDSGTGMSQPVIDKIFEPFFTTKELSKGTGLGLSTVMAIVKSHEGLINVYSEPGRGSTFKVYLPAMGDSGDSPLESERALPSRGNGETILVIDDEAPILTVTDQTLKAFGYKSLVAVDGAEGVAIYAQHASEVAVVLTDMNMPIMNGMATIRALMKINPKAKIVATSGLNVIGDTAKLAEMGVTHSLAKPYTAETLLSTLHQILRPVALST
jgi:PAS domain S-box-containing protein